MRCRLPSRLPRVIAPHCVILQHGVVTPNVVVALRVALALCVVVALHAIVPPALAAPDAAAMDAPDDVDPALLEHLARRLADETTAPDAFDAEVWLKWMQPRLERVLPSAEERLEVLRAVWTEAHRNDVDPDLVLAVIDVESRFDRFAVSRAGAQGVMQVMPFWRTLIGREGDNLMQIDTNVRYGVAILAHYLAVSRGDLVAALGRYNGSHGLLHYPERVVAAWRGRWQTRETGDIDELVAGCSSYRLAACRGAGTRR
jgi:soluble lytic murein transglycosylase-like protein